MAASDTVRNDTLAEKVDDTRRGSSLDDIDPTEDPGIGSHTPRDSDDETTGLRREHPTEDEMRTLRRVSDKIPWPAFTIAFVELCERFSYYGTTAVCKPRSVPFHYNSSQISCADFHDL